jgi:hypothetical protein
VKDKAKRVYHFHHNTMHALAEVIASAGVKHPHDLSPDRLMIKQASMKSVPASKYYDLLEPNVLLKQPESTYLDEAWKEADPQTF